MTPRRLRILVAKPGLDGHDRGAKIIARALRDAGFEVVYTGLHQTPEMIAAAAVQEDVDAVGLSVMSGAHMTLFPAVLDLLRQHGASEVVVFGGGIIPQGDVERLKALGVAEVFLPGTPTQAAVEWIRRNVKAPGERASDLGQASDLRPQASGEAVSTPGELRSASSVQEVPSPPEA